jgi:hypothetical protein
MDDSLFTLESFLKHLTIRRTGAVGTKAMRKCVLKSVDDEVRRTARLVAIQKRAVTSDHVVFVLDDCRRPDRPIVRNSRVHNRSRLPSLRNLSARRPRTLEFTVV